MPELTLEEKTYLLGLLGDALRKHKEYLETSGEYPMGKQWNRNNIIGIYQSLGKVMNDEDLIFTNNSNEFFKTNLIKQTNYTSEELDNLTNNYVSTNKLSLER